MKAPDTNVTGGGRNIDAEIAKESPAKTLADFPINDKLLLDEITKAPKNGYIHIQFEADESIQHPETRDPIKEAEEVLLDEVAKKAPVDYPDIE